MIESLNLEDLSDQKVTSRENVIKRDIAIYGHIKAKAHILVGNAEVSIEELMSLKKGSVVKMLENIDEPMLLVLDGKTIAKGSLVVVDDVFGFEITEIAE
jgi:flagellar motor switch protein FliN